MTRGFSSPGKPGLTPARHREIGDRLATLRDELLALGVEVANAYPKNSRESRSLLGAVHRLDLARSALDDAFHRDHRAEAAAGAYYPDRGGR